MKPGKFGPGGLDRGKEGRGVVIGSNLAPGGTDPAGKTDGMPP